MTAEYARAESTSHDDPENIERLIATVAARLDQDARRGFRLPPVRWRLLPWLIAVAVVAGGVTVISTALITGDPDPGSHALIATAVARHSEPGPEALQRQEEALYPVLPPRTETKSQPAVPSPDEPAKSGVSPEMTTNNEKLSEGTIALLLSQGDALLSRGDVSSGRLFYTRAVEAGSAQAAFRLGASYDALFLVRAGVRGARGDPALAAYWYERARALGAGDKADAMLKGVKTK